MYFLPQRLLIQWRAGIVLSFDRQSGRHLIEYDDGQVEWLLFYHADYRLVDVTTDEGQKVGFHAWLPQVLKAKAAAREAAGQKAKNSWAKLLLALEVKNDSSGTSGREEAAAELMRHPNHAVTLGLKGEALVGHGVSVQWSDGKVSYPRG